MQPLASISGLVSGLNTNAIIQSAVAAIEAPIQQYQSQQTTLQDQLNVYQQADSLLSALQQAAQQLATPSNLNVMTANSSNPDVLSATANSSAAPGTYNITVNNIAQAEQDISQSYGDYNTTSVGTGTFSIASGGQTTTVTLTGANDTLQGLANAINAADTNVQASIVQVGDSSYSLMVAAKDTGSANALTITNSLSGGTALSFSQLQAAQDASVTLGSGANALTVTRSTNTVSDLIPGVTMSLLAASPGNAVSVNVGQDTSGMTTNVQNLVSAYNSFVTYINQQYQYSSSSTSSSSDGTMLGDNTLQTAETQIESLLTQTVPGGAGSVQSLEAMGISFNADGTMTLNTSALQSALTSDPTGVTNTLALTGTTSEQDIQYLSAGSKTNAAGGPYAVNITQVATQAHVTAGAAQSGALSASETLTINGVPVNLTAGMSQDQVVQAINASSSQTGVTASETGATGAGAGNYLTLAAAQYGSAAAITAASSLSDASGVTSGIGNVSVTAVNAAGQTGNGTGAAGVDVAGTIGGEVATGSGQVLMGKAGNANTDGLSLLVTATTTGAHGAVTLNDGVANAVANIVAGLTDPTNGTIQQEETGINTQITNLQTEITNTTNSAAAEQTLLEQKFATMEATLSQLQSQQQYLTAEMAAINGSSSSSGSSSSGSNGIGGSSNSSLSTG